MTIIIDFKNFNFFHMKQKKNIFIYTICVFILKNERSLIFFYQIFILFQDPPLSSVNGQIRGYTVNYRKEGNTKYKIIGLNVIQKKKSYIIEGLEPWTTYEVGVALFNLHYKIQSDVVEVIVKGNGKKQRPFNLHYFKID